MTETPHTVRQNHHSHCDKIAETDTSLGESRSLPSVDDVEPLASAASSPPGAAPPKGERTPRDERDRG